MRKFILKIKRQSCAKNKNFKLDSLKKHLNFFFLTFRNTNGTYSVSRNDPQLTVRSKGGRSTPGTFKSSDIRSYQATLEHEKPRALRGESSRFNNSSEYLDRIENVEHPESVSRNENQI